VRVVVNRLARRTGTRAFRPQAGFLSTLSRAGVAYSVDAERGGLLGVHDDRLT
jgi:hypothetical protein